MSNSSDPDQGNVGPDLEPDHLQRLSADDTRGKELNWQKKIYANLPSVQSVNAVISYIKPGDIIVLFYKEQLE